MLILWQQNYSVSILYNTCEHRKGHAKPKWRGLFPLFALCVMSDVVHYTQTTLWFFLRTAGSCTQVINNLKLLLSHSNPYLPLKKFTNHPLKLKPCITFTIPDIIQQETNLYCVLVHVLRVFVYYVIKSSPLFHKLQYSIWKYS